MKIGRATLSLSGLFLFCCPAHALLMALIWTIPVIILVFAPQILPVDLLAGISGPGFLCALLYNKTFKKFEPEVEEKDADDWTVEVEEESTQDNDIEG